ncbi:MAG: response regulator [Terriglobia bacterium]
MNRESILVADDDRVAVRLLSESLKALGFNVLVAYDAMQAWMTTQRATPAAIVLDVNMPGGSGLEVLRKLKRSAKTSTIPVLVVSGSAGADLLQEVQALGPDEFLPKPIDREHLRLTLCRLLGKPLGSPPESG